MRTAVAKSSTNHHIMYYRLGQTLLRVGDDAGAVEAFSAAIEAAKGLTRDSRVRKTATMPPTTLIFYNNCPTELFRFDVPDMLSFDKPPSEEDQTRTAFPEFTAARGKAKVLLGRFSEALRDFEESSRLDERNALTYFEKSTANRVMGRYADALADVETCAGLWLTPDVAFNKGIILENSGDGAGALRIYDAILDGAFSADFSPEFLRALKARGSVIDAVVADHERERAGVRAPAPGEAAKCAHESALYHAALIRRAQGEARPALALVDRALALNAKDARYWDLKAAALLDLNDCGGAAEAATRSIELQRSGPVGVAWETFYARARALSALSRFDGALADLVAAQACPAGGATEKQMKKPEADRVVGLLLRLPPGTSLAVAYLNAQGVSAIPHDPLAPRSAARGVEDAAVQPYPVLDLAGAFPGRSNCRVVLEKARCLFVLRDYVGCVRALSGGLEDFDWGLAERGRRKLTAVEARARAGEPLCRPGEACGVGEGAEASPETVSEAQALVEVELNQEERDLLHEMYFLRARALAMLNRLPHALKDVRRAREVFAGAFAPELRAGLAGLGSPLFFEAKLCAYMRLYARAYHAARDALRSGLLPEFQHRAYYV